MKFNPVLENLTPYRAGPSLDEIRRLYGRDEIIQLAANEAPWGPFPEVAQALASVIGGLNRYPDGGGTRLKALLAERLAVSESQLCLGNGSCELLMLLGQALLTERHHMVFPHPSFVMYKSIALLNGGPFTGVPLKDFAPDLDGILGAIRDDTSLLIVCNPNNPTGGYVDTASLRSFIESVPPDVVIVLDEAYVEFVTLPEHQDTAAWVTDHRNLVVLRTFSKIYGLAGLRVGYAVADPEIVHALDKVRQPFNVDSLAQTAAAESLLHGERVAERRGLIAAEKTRLVHELQGLGIGSFGGQANFILMDVTGLGIPGPQVGQELLARGILTRSGYAMDCPGWIRVTIGDEHQNDLFLSAVADLRTGKTNTSMQAEASVIDAESLSPES
jgi:histidinol-phosphate aminotransferase